MGAAFNQLMENETKATLAMMVCDMLPDRKRLIELEPVVSFAYEALNAWLDNENPFAFASVFQEVAEDAGFIEEAPYDPERHETEEDGAIPGLDGWEMTDAAISVFTTKV